MLVNTAGGITGGDLFNYECGAHASDVTVTTQAAERAYRSSADELASLTVKLTAQKGAKLHWLPQETILFDNSRLARSIDVHMDQSSECLLLESLVFGRRIHRDGRLVHAEALRLDRDLDHCLAHGAGANGAQMMAVAIYVGPRAGPIHNDMKTALDHVASRAAVSTWNDKVVMRLLAQDTMTGKRDLTQFLTAMGGVQVPRVWQ